MNQPEVIPTDFYNIPEEITCAARDIELFFKNNGAETWEFMGLCSRNHADALREMEKEIKSLELEIENMEYGYMENYE